MAWQFPPYLFILLSAVPLALVVAAACWQRRAAPGALPFALLMLAAAWWAALRALEGAAVSYDAKLAFGKLAYLGVASVPPLWLMAALSYSGFERWLTRRNVIWLWCIPVITMGLALTNEWHAWLWSSVIPASDLSGSNLVYQRGAWWYVTLIYSYALLAVGSIVLVRQAVRMDRALRRQAFLLIVAVAIPWVANIMNLLRIYPVPGFDFTPFALAVSGCDHGLGGVPFSVIRSGPVGAHGHH